MISHISLGVKDYQKSCKFYKETLSLLLNESLLPQEGVYPPVVQNDIVYYNGVRFTNFIDLNSNIVLCIEDLTYGIKEPLQNTDYGSPKGLHVAFKGKTKESVDAWYTKALELGATDNGAPGLRPQYIRPYYGAFVIDPSGYRIEACIVDYTA